MTKKTDNTKHPIAIRLDDKLAEDMKRYAKFLGMSQTDYIKGAIYNSNIEIGKLEKRQRIEQASLKVRDDSMVVNAEFEGLNTPHHNQDNDDKQD